MVSFVEPPQIADSITVIGADVSSSGASVHNNNALSQRERILVIGSGAAGAAASLSLGTAQTYFNISNAGEAAKIVGRASVFGAIGVTGYDLIGATIDYRNSTQPNASDALWRSYGKTLVQSITGFGAGFLSSPFVTKVFAGQKMKTLQQAPDGSGIGVVEW